MQGVYTAFFKNLAGAVGHLDDLRRLDLCDWSFDRVRRASAEAPRPFTEANLEPLLCVLATIQSFEELNILVCTASASTAST